MLRDGLDLFDERKKDQLSCVGLVCLDPLDIGGLTLNSIGCNKSVRFHTISGVGKGVGRKAPTYKDKDMIQVTVRRQGSLDVSVLVRV